MNRLLIDMSAAWRHMRARPAAVAAAIAVLALGIGLVTAIFAIADPFFRPLPYLSPDQLVLITVDQPPGFIERRGRGPADMPTLAAWAQRTDLFVSVAAFRRRHRSLRLRVDDAVVALDAMEVSSGFFEVLGLQAPDAGGASGGAEGALQHILLTSGAVERVFARSTVVGRVFPCQDTGAVLVTGVLPRSFFFPWPGATRRTDGISTIEVSRIVDPGGLESPFVVIARLHPGVTSGAVRAALNATLDQSSHLTVTVQALSVVLTQRVRPLAFGAIAAAALVLLVCAANIANLLLVRYVYRAGEFATRRALGASRVDLARLMMVDVLFHTIAGAAGGFLLAKLMLVIGTVCMPEQYAVLGDPQLTARVVIVGTLAAFVIVIVALIPTAIATRARAVLTTGPMTNETPATRAVRFGMAASQTSLALVLLIGANLFVHSYVNLISQDTGFSGDVIVVPTTYPLDYSTPRLLGDVDTTVARLRTVRAVQACAAVVGPMLNGMQVGSLLFVNGRNVPVVLKWVSANYFDTVGDRVIAGRVFTWQRLTQPSVIVNESLARLAWPGKSPVGQPVGASGSSSQVIGIVRDTFDQSLDRSPEPTAFFPIRDMPQGMPFVTYVARLVGDSRSGGVAVRDIVARTNRDAVIGGHGSINERLADSIRDRSFATLVLALFAVSSLGVCVAGIVGLVAFVVVRRTRELAIRLALGAPRWALLSMTVRETACAALVGSGVALLISAWLSKVVQTLLYGVRPGDWEAVLAASVLMLAVAVASAAIPARRALRLSPALALRVD